MSDTPRIVTIEEAKKLANIWNDMDAPTPRTDAEQQKYSLSTPQAYEAWEFSRILERELNAANKRIEELQAELKLYGEDDNH